MKKTFLLLCFSFSLMALASTYADDVIVSVKLDPHEDIFDDRVGGTLTAEVINLTGGAIKNVNLRPAGVSDVATSREVLQFGRLEAGESKAAHEPFHASIAFMDSGKPTTWRLDFDEADGAHRQLIITAN